MIKRPCSKFAAIITSAYGLLCFGALLLPITAKSGESLAGVYAALFAMPWSMFLGVLTVNLAVDSVVFNYIFLILGMAINAAVLYVGISAVSMRFSKRL